ncbi:MAG: permease-like cell division protein FtsX [Clostridia bacterium]
MYSLKTAFSSLGRNAVMTIASIVTIACCLFLFGVFLLFAFNINYIGEQISAQCELQAYIDETVSDANEERILMEISSLPNVVVAEFESKEQAFENYKEKLGDMASALDGMEGEDILRSSVKVTLSDLTAADETAAAMAAVSGVAKVVNRRDIIQKVVNVTNVIKIGSLIAMIILLVTAVFIIQNTIKLSVHAREDEIHIMKFVGATDRFIRRPFVIEGVSVGIIGAAISIVVIAFGYNAAVTKLTEILDLFELYSFSQVALPLTGGLLLFGILMGAFGSRTAVRKHLKV